MINKNSYSNIKYSVNKISSEQEEITVRSIYKAPYTPLQIE